MTDRRWLFVLIGLTLGITFTAIPPAEAQLKWFGFSDLCFEGEFKGGSATNGELTIKLTGLTIETSCIVLGSQQSCQPGSGNLGDLTITVPAAASATTKEKGTLFASGCIPMDKWDHHFSNTCSISGAACSATDPCGEGEGECTIAHQHTCNPLSNINKVEIENSGHIDSIKTEWVLTSNGKVILNGFQECGWPGGVNPDTCLPEPHNLEFICPIDVTSKK